MLDKYAVQLQWRFSTICITYDTKLRIYFFGNQTADPEN